MFITRATISKEYRGSGMSKILFATLNEEGNKRGYEYHLQFATTKESLNAFLKFWGPEDKLLRTYKYYFDTNGFLIFEEIEKLDADRYRTIFTLSPTKAYFRSRFKL